ncbi:DUF1559 domain-containing protein [Planctomicrobium sp. SH527]|uniref:DUF1559 domain-containing protein n=1 Tax=Planctomicrobium sp. SH527 TaxID=3448123 RepID=UPI003F5C365C
MDHPDLSDSQSDAEVSQQPSKNRLLRRIIGWSSSILIVIVLLALFLPLPRSANVAARRSQCKNNLKQIGLALHQYHDEYGVFPPAFTVDAQGSRLHSWRSLILPYLGQKDLYDKIDFSKPWDDPVNAGVRKASLPSYRCPSTLIPDNHTGYVVIVGEGFAFSPIGPQSLSEFKDGPELTAMVIELPINRSYEWMEPRDGTEADFGVTTPMPAGSHIGGMHVAFADGAVRFLSDKTPQKNLRAFLTISGGEEIGEF